MHFNRIKNIWIIIIAFLFLAGNKFDKENKFPFIINYYDKKIIQLEDENKGKLYMVYDSLPLFYYMDIATEVCYTQICKPAFIRIFWDVSGSFLGFDIPENTPLTKTGHQEFTKYDYFLLFSILNNPYSVLANMKYNDLTSGNPELEANQDGYTGATTIIDKNSVVNGAVYTCYTLWHIVYDRNIKDSILKSTKRLIKKYQEPHTINLNHPAHLTLLLEKTDNEKKLGKLKYQKTFVKNINDISPLNALLINNYINRQVFVFPVVQNKLSECKANQFSFEQMVHH